MRTTLPYPWTGFALLALACCSAGLSAGEFHPPPPIPGPMPQPAPSVPILPPEAPKPEIGPKSIPGPPGVREPLAPVAPPAPQPSKAPAASAAAPDGETAPQDEPEEPDEPAPPASLYVHLKGTGAVAAFAADLALAARTDEGLLAHPPLKDALADASPTHLCFQLTALLCALAGGPERYTGEPLPALYKRLDLGAPQWQALQALFERTLDARKTEPDIREAWLQQFARLQKLLQASDDRLEPYRLDAKRCELLLPRSWERRAGKGETLFTVYSPALSPKDTFRENISLVVQALPLEMTAAEVGKSWLMTAGKQVQDFKLLAHGPAGWEGREVYRIAYTGRVGEQAIAVTCCVSVRGLESFTLNGIAAADQADAFKPAFEAIAKSLKLE